MARPSPPLFSALTLDRGRPQALHRQLYDELRAAILGKRLPAGTRLPATRTLARELAVSRNTVLEAYEQLLAEGYLRGRVGAGTFVDPAIAPARPLAALAQPKDEDTPARVSRRSRAAAAAVSGLDPRLPLAPGVPYFDGFPLAAWARLAARRIRDASLRQLNYGEPAGEPRLRAAIAAHLAAARGVRCAADQVLLVAGAQQGIDLVARLLLDAGDSAWLEDPGYLGARAVFAATGVRVAPVPVDDNGLVVAAGVRRAPRARLAYVTPSHQFPTGTTMSLPRRLELLAWARGASAYVIEDDYDSEFRFGGRSLPALQGLDTAGRVIYLGTFSKVLFPSLRCAYLVMPRSLLGAMIGLKGALDSAAPLIDHAVLADFIAAGHFSRHIRRARAHYARRREAFHRAVAERFGDAVRLGAVSGLHTVLWLPRGLDDRDVAARLRARGVGTAPLSAFALRRRLPPGLVVGQANASPAQMTVALAALESVLESAARKARRA